MFLFASTAFAATSRGAEQFNQGLMIALFLFIAGFIALLCIIFWDRIKADLSSPQTPVHVFLRDTLVHMGFDILTQPAPPSPKPPVNTGNPLEDALRDFAELEPDFSPTLPDLPPHAHMTAALAYLEQIEARVAKPMDHADASSLLSEVGRAAEHLTRARQKDPDATITVPGTKGDPVTLTLDFLSSQALYREGRLSVVAAKTWDAGGNEVGYEYLKRAQGAFERAIKYRPDSADFYYELAEVHKLLGQQGAGLSAAHKALALDPTHVPTIKFIDFSGGDWKPLFRNTPDPVFKEPLPVKTAMVVGGILLMALSRAFDVPIAPVMVVAGVGLCIGAFMMWRNERNVAAKMERDYAEYKHDRDKKEIARFFQDDHRRRYEAEEENK